MGERHPPDDRSAAADRATSTGTTGTTGTTGRRSNQALGRWGELQAAAWYERRGCVVVDRNWRCDRGELDLVVLDGETVVFVEVKARSTDRFGAASAAVGEHKQQTLRMLAARWFAEHPGRRGDMRFDVIAITGTQLEWIPHAF